MWRFLTGVKPPPQKKAKLSETAADLFSKGDWFFKFDYKSGYHHIEILPQHCQLLGFSPFF